MTIHFSEAEMSSRKSRLLAAMAAERLDGLLLFAQESDYWLTGYDTFGFCFFQCLYVGADGRVALLTRSADLRQAQHTSNIEDIRVWKDGANADPVRELCAMLDDLGAGARLGVEFDSYGLTHFWGRRLEAALASRATLVDASRLVPGLRVVKSAEELVYVREAARLSDLADRAAIDATRSGADEGQILAAMHSAMHRSAPATSLSSRPTAPAPHSAIQSKWRPWTRYTAWPTVMPCPEIALRETAPNRSACWAR